MAIKEADKTKLITLEKLVTFFNGLKNYLVGRVFSDIHFTRTEDSNYTPGTPGIIDVKLGRILDDGVAHKDGKGNYNTVLATNGSRFLTNGQTLVNIKDNIVNGQNQDNNTTLNKTGLGQTISNTYGLTVSNSVFKARGAEIDWTNGRSWDTLNYLLSPGIYTINHKMPESKEYKDIPNGAKVKSDGTPAAYNASKFNGSESAAASAYTIDNELNGGGMAGLDIPKIHGTVTQIRLTVTSIYIGANKERLRVYQQAQVVTSKNDKLSTGSEFSQGGHVFVRIGEGPSGRIDLSNDNYFEPSTTFKFTSWRNISEDISTSKTYLPQMVKDDKNGAENNQQPYIEFQDGGIFTVLPTDFQNDNGMPAVTPQNPNDLQPLYRVANNKTINVQLPDFSTMTTTKPQTCTLYVYNYGDVVGQKLRLFIEKPFLINWKDGTGENAPTGESLSHDVMCSYKSSRFISHHGEKNTVEHKDFWFTVLQWGQLQNKWYYSGATDKDKAAKYRVLALYPHYNTDGMFVENGNTHDGQYTQSQWGGANGIYKFEIKILFVGNIVPTRDHKGEYYEITGNNGGGRSDRNISHNSISKYYHVIVEAERIGWLDPTFSVAQGKFKGYTKPGTNRNSTTTLYSLLGINTGKTGDNAFDYYTGYGKFETNHSGRWPLEGSITDLHGITGATEFAFAQLENHGSNGIHNRGIVDFEKYRQSPNMIYTKK